MYNSGFDSSETCLSILKNNKSIKLSGIIYDNSAQSNYDERYMKIGDFQYLHNKNNPGISEAYNYALQEALARGFKWMILFDQDSNFTESYFAKLNEVIVISENMFSIKAFIPIVKSLNNSIISPSKIGYGGFKSYNNYKLGVQEQCISGINSGTFINCDFFHKIGGFNVDYPLDFLDHWYFREIFRRKFNVYLFEGIVYQNLSVSSGLDQSISLKRYKSILNAECQFYGTDSFINFIFYKLRLIFRTIKLFKFKDKRYSKASFISIFRFWKNVKK
ncbi:hypothetical protein [Sphingobacterium multivorum]|uniref:hypothetical protein n=1 Tax=Sphingobacterium multivorum TaxID=28454 RepID=UPI0028A60AC2|nr:hypothetical protein [Sphingobacterium multivorum]